MQFGSKNNQRKNIKTVNQHARSSCMKTKDNGDQCYIILKHVNNNYNEENATKKAE